MNLLQSSLHPIDWCFNNPMSSGLRVQSTIFTSIHAPYLTPSATERKEAFQSMPQGFGRSSLISRRRPVPTPSPPKQTAVAILLQATRQRRRLLLKVQAMMRTGMVYRMLTTDVRPESVRTRVGNQHNLRTATRTVAETTMRTTMMTTTASLTPTIFARHRMDG